MTNEEYRLRSCKGKRAFNTEEEALRFIENASGDPLFVKSRHRDHRYTLVPYQCKYCPAFHVGHTNTDRRKPVPPKAMRDGIPPGGKILIVNPLFVGWAIKFKHPAFEQIKGDPALPKNHWRVIPHEPQTA